eukprot:1146778-Pelagomonas_calceolata.AAC.1
MFLHPAWISRISEAISGSNHQSMSPVEDVQWPRSDLHIFLLTITDFIQKRIPRAEAPFIPFTKRSKRKKSMGIRKVTSSSPCLFLVVGIERSLLKSAPGVS